MALTCRVRKNRTKQKIINRFAMTMKRIDIVFFFSFGIISVFVCRLCLEPYNQNVLNIDVVITAKANSRRYGCIKKKHSNMVNSGWEETNRERVHVAIERNKILEIYSLGINLFF